MKRKKKPSPVAMSDVAHGSLREPSAVAGSFDGSKVTADRGYYGNYAYIRNVSSKREVDSFSRSELATRISAIYNNTGIGHRIINNIARMVCGTGLMPEPMTRDLVYNERVKQLRAERLDSPKVFSLNQKFSFGSAQRALKRAQLKEGDACMIPARDASGRIRMALYEGRQIGSGSSRDKRMHDGVMCDENDAPLSYRVLGWVDGKLVEVDVPAAECFFFAKYERIGQMRGVTCLAHAVNKLVDRAEINAAITTGIKGSQQLAYVTETEAGSQPPKTGGNLTPRGPGVVVQGPNGPVKLEKIFGGGGDVLDLGPGQSLKILHDERPHPNTVNHLNDMVRDIAGGTGYSTEILWNMESLGGANTRFIMADTQSQIEEDQEEMIEQVLAPAYIRLLQDWEENGDLEPCTDPMWWMHEWLTPARLTVDFGRDGKIHIDQWHRGHITLKSLYGFKGEEWKRQTTQWLEEVAWKKEEMKRLNLVASDLPAIPGASNNIIETPEETTPAPTK